jgi:hypothetical protein
MLLREITAVYSDNRTKTINALYVKEGGTYSYHWDLKGKKQLIIFK